MKTDEDEAVDENGIQVDDAPAHDPLSLKGYVLLLLSASKRCAARHRGCVVPSMTAHRHELSASAGSYTVDSLTDIAATDLEFEGDAVVVRSEDGSERARFGVSRLSWRSPA